MSVDPVAVALVFNEVESVRGELQFLVNECIDDFVTTEIEWHAHMIDCGGLKALPCSDSRWGLLTCLRILGDNRGSVKNLRK